jgi:type VI secretion system protein ImpG
MRVNDEEFLRYYWEELLYLRRVGQSFAKSYPKIAARLELQGDECPDPHVERLIESFAFLTARIQRNLDNDFPEIGAELLNILYPQYLLPTPSMAIARFDVDPKRTKLTSGYVVPRETKLFAAAGHGAICRWRTTAPVTLWPITIEEAVIESADQHAFLDQGIRVGRHPRPVQPAGVLRLRLVSQADPFENLELDRLRFYLDGDPVLVQRLYELLLDGTIGTVMLSPVDPVPDDLELGTVHAGGFGDDEELLPYPPQAHPGYRLLQEYFTFPEKFHFIDVENVRRSARGTAVDLFFLLRRMPRQRLNLDTTTFALGCAPIVNLFEKTTEPIRVDHRRLEYRLVADAQREKTTGIHSILSVSGSVNPSDPTRHYAPFYSWTHDMSRSAQRTFWHAKRVLSLYDQVAGTETLLSFVDLDFEPTQPPAETIWAHALCTNRGLAAELPAGALLHTDMAGLPVSHIVCLKKPTQEIQPPLGGRTLWSLVSHLSLNHLSLSESKLTLKALREILRLYCTSEQPSLEQQIAGIEEVKVRQVMRRFGKDLVRGFARGTEVTLRVDESAFVGSSAFLFTSVLSRFLSLYSSTNSFTQLVVHSAQREGEWKRWQPMAGGRIVL